MSPLTVTQRVSLTTSFCLFLLLHTACNFVDNVSTSQACTPQDSPREGMVCQDHMWRAIDQMMDMNRSLEMNDMSADGARDADLSEGDACAAETDAELCLAQEVSCGALTRLVDRCGRSRDVAECGPCGNAETCSAGQCIPECAGQTSELLCGQSGAQCGPIHTTDSCGNARQPHCGPCPGREACQTDGTCLCSPNTQAELCQQAGAQCGVLNIDDGCGQLIDISCGSCDMAGDFSCTSDNQCACVAEADAQFCGRLNAQCGMKQGKNNCDAMRTVNCGPCDNNDACKSDNTCPVCQPLGDQALCANLGLSCGTHSVTDNCGTVKTIDCGTACGTDKVCNAAGTCECSAPSCAGVACGAVSNACGNSITCPNTCDATTQMCAGNTCACKPDTDAELCAAAGATCGTITRTDRCGTSRANISCGGCGGGQVCAAQACCMPQSNAELCSAHARTCGSLTAIDNCGTSRTVNTCGTCSNDRVCTTGTCECPGPSCAGVACGAVSNACGHSTSCPNTCNATTQVCAGNTCACKPDTDAELCAAAGATCGTITRTDRCGTSRTIASCGGCGADASCEVNQCVCSPAPLCQNFQCGTVSNACGRTRQCMCPNNFLCLGGYCEPSCGGVPC